MPDARSLSTGESRILRIIQEGYGPQNTEHDVFFTDSGGAALFVKDRSGERVLAAVLTNLAAWCEDGTIANDDALKKDWLQLPVP